MFTRSTARVAALACVGALALGACGSSDKKSADSTSATTVQTGDAASATNTTMKATDASSKSATLPCDFITKEQATKLFGHPAEKQDQQQQNQQQQNQNQNQQDQQQNQNGSLPGEQACFWESRPEPGTSYLLQIRMADKPYYFTGDLGGYTKLDGLGDKAAVRVSPTGTEVFITWVDGSHSNNVTYSAHKIGAKGLPEKQKDELIALVKKAANG
jgi:type II secretory pathway pseudopilin PulG